MADDRAKELLRRLDQLASERAPRESQWQEITELMNPMRADFTVQRSPGQKRSQKIFDGTAGIAAENLVSGLWAMITNSANKWFEMRSAIDDLNKIQNVKLWLDFVTAAMRNAFAAEGGMFYARVVDLYADLVSIGTGVFFNEEAPGYRGRMFYSCRHPTECYIAQDDNEKVDTVFRKFCWTARQATKRWGDAVSDKVKSAMAKEPDKKFDFLHAVYPNEAYEAGKLLSLQGRAFRSCYVDIEGATLVEESGYHEFPYQVPRWSTRSRDVWGDSQAMLVLPDVKMLNTMSKTTIVGAQKRVDPPILAPDEMGVRGVRTSPGKIIYGGIDPQGRALYQTLETRGDIGLSLEMEDQRRNAIREGFFWSLLMLTNGPDRETATAYLGRDQEKLRLMGPHLGRTQAELLDPLLSRQFAVMYRAGAFPPPPRELLAYPDIRVEYMSPLARAQKITEGSTVVRALESLAPLAAADPQVYDVVDGDEAARAVLDGFGVPAKIHRDPAAVQALRDQRRQQVLAEKLAGAAQPVAAAAKSAAEAAQIGQQVAGGRAA